MIKNRNGLVVDTELVQPSGTAERKVATLIEQRIQGAEPSTTAG